jgi:hypothetical protein
MEVIDPRLAVENKSYIDYGGNCERGAKSGINNGEPEQGLLFRGEVGS